MHIIAAELTDNAVSLSSFHSPSEDIAVIFGNEVEGVLLTTLTAVDEVVKIQMKGTKESMNIGQATAIFMRELGK